MDMRFGTWNIRSLYRAGSLMTILRELSRYRLHLVGVQEVRLGQLGQLGMKVYTKFVMIMKLRVVNFAPYKNLFVKSTMFPHPNIHKYTWTSPDRKTHSQTDHILIEVNVEGTKYVLVSPDQNADQNRDINILNRLF
jgi:exoribonuclease II